MPKTDKNIEITRSFSQKVSMPDNQYQMRDFFMSAKAEVSEDEVEEKSKELNELCQREVEKSIQSYLDEAAAKQSERARQLGEEWQEKHNKETALNEERINLLRENEGNTSQNK